MSDYVELRIVGSAYSDQKWLCQICRKSIKPDESIYVLIRDKYPWLLEDDDDQDYDIFEWHKDCDPGTIAADQAEELAFLLEEGR